MNEIIDKYKELLEIEVHQSDKYQKYLKLNEVMQNYVSKIKDIEYLIEKAKNEDDYLKASELINEKDKLEVRQMPSLDEDTIVLYVYASKSDIARLIGRKGMMANSIRQFMSVSGRLNHQKLDIKFESYGE